MGNQQEYFLSYLADAAKVAVAFADAFTGDLSHISIRIRSRANALASDLNHAYISARVSDLALASALADASERSRILALASDLSSVLALDLRFELDRPRSSEFDFTLASDLANASICISSFASFHLTKPDKTKFFTLARLLALLSICISFRSYELVNLQPKAGASLELRDLSILRGKERTQGQLIDIQETLNVGMEINRRLELLEKRSRKDEPAYEGILIVKECGPTMMAGIK